MCFTVTGSLTVYKESIVAIPLEHSFAKTPQGFVISTQLVLFKLCTLGFRDRRKRVNKDRQGTNKCQYQELLVMKRRKVKEAA
jgi:hypothetical protein